MSFMFCRNNLSDHVYLFLVVLLMFKVGRNNLSGHCYVYHVVMTCYTSTCQQQNKLDHINITATFEESIDASVHEPSLFAYLKRTLFTKIGSNSLERYIQVICLKKYGILSNKDNFKKTYLRLVSHMTDDDIGHVWRNMFVRLTQQ